MPNESSKVSITKACANVLGILQTFSSSLQIQLRNSQDVEECEQLYKRFLQKILVEESSEKTHTVEDF